MMGEENGKVRESERGEGKEGVRGDGKETDWRRGGEERGENIGDFDVVCSTSLHLSLQILLKYYRLSLSLLSMLLFYILSLTSCHLHV